MTGTGDTDASAQERSWVAGQASPPEQRSAEEGTERLSGTNQLTTGADLADDQHSAFTVLERQTCFNLLATRDLGRVAFTIEGDAAPTVLPVNYAMVDDTIVLRSTLAGTIMRHARGYAAFQIDHFDEDRREGWSVLASGRCRWVRDPAELERIPQGRLPQPWAEGPRDQVLKITPGRVTGREVHHT
ncbi:MULTISPECIES: pyridoxamine 5'-phosphate oxidase family protein [unclassified Nocardiopsis]|jgi:nitroimidazol reductase NimA-like FMN-containing flavoprotein (pyridoxamine 5'-phosphate oxidase superfamily)|uniref:pyridoxamine 5'-phosphate oxidase family protein n=1 Tax=unclassified Nocardiopsis TaxID=2649073 RepID=UPI00066D21FE|nr:MULTISPECIES: pyridoxamine 5'-phosphate oxidase family protein [unclassified Nocardiopsis]MBQ1079692.1 pyridoxamine 5'-phosphate oxidase family protein [Nocardiopsis sp. B62]